MMMVEYLQVVVAFSLSADDSLDVSGELRWGEDCREGGLDDVDASDSEILHFL